MACTSQSAVDYIQQARVHLVRELRSLSVIIENLYQQEVLSDEEVSKIQAETDDYDKTRKILDSVIKKGEQACYVLLRIIDMTRKRTLGRSSLFPEKKSEASTGTKKFDLHHWISCFSFKEDTHMDVNYLQGPRPCHRYQRKLKSKAQKISNKFWMANKNLFEERNRPDLSYTPLVLEEQGNVSPSKIKKLKSKKSKMSRPKKLRTYIPEDKPEISPSDLLKTDKDYVLVGKPGIGKTALTHEMLKLWAERDGEELDYMFYFDMRETSDLMKATSLEDLLFSVFSEPDEGKEEVLDDIKKNSDNVTIIFDGITDLSSSVVKRLVDKDLLPDAKIIITCRPDDEEDFFSRDFRRVEVKGFSEWSIKTYLSVTLGEEQKKVLNNLELLTLCHVPMYALMVSVCFSSEISPQPCTTTEIYINIVRLCLKMNSNKKKTKCLNFYINNKREQILSLAEAAFNAAERKTVILTDLSCEDSCVLSFLKPLFIKVAHTETITAYSFLHYTMQEFFAALWLLKNPDKVQDVFQQSLTEEMKHMRHLIPFMCRLLNEKNPSLMTCLIPAEELRSTSDGFFKELINKDRGSDVDILFLCQCLYESQCPEACSDLLNTLDYSLDLSEQSLDPYSCCAVAYVVSQSKERKIHLDLENVVISEQGMRRLIGCLQRVQWCDPLPRQLWKIFLLSEEQMDHSSLLGVDGNQLHLPVEGKKQLFEGAVKVMQKVTTKVNVCLYWDRPTPVCQHLCESLFEGLLHISSLSFRVTHRDPGSEDQERHHETLRREKKRLLLELCLKAALHKEESFHSVVKRLFSLFSVNTDLINILLDFYQHVKSEGCSSVIPKLRSVFQSAPSVWIIDLSERKTSILLEVLKLQPEKKQVELTGWSDEESEVRSLLQCLPYISQLSFVSQSSDPSDEARFFGNLFCAAAEREQQTGEKILELLSSVCTYQTFHLNDRDMDDDDDYDPEYQCDFLLDLFSHVKDYETKTGLRVLPSLQSVFQSVFQSAPPVWFIDLSERKTSILLEVLKLQPEKKRVELTGWSDEESEVRSLLQCLPYISQLRLSSHMVLQLFHWVRRGRLFCPLAVDELSLAPDRAQLSDRELLKVVSGLASLLRYCAVRRLDLTESCFPAQCLITLLLHPGSLTIRLSEESFQQLLTLLHEIQDQDLTLFFLSKVGGDLNCCCVNWELLHYLLQQPSAQTITVNLRKNHFLQENVTRLLPFLDRILLKRSSPSFVLAAIREIYKAQTSQIIPSLQRSLGHVINLTCRELDSEDCAALLFTLRHSDRVKLNLTWTSIPTEETQSILCSLDRVSQLSVDRNLLLRFIHCCAASDVLQEAASDLFRTLQHRLDLSCSSCVELEDQTQTLCLTGDDCRAVLRHSTQLSQLDLRDCEVEDSGLDLLFPVLHRVHLRASKAVLLQLLSLVPVNPEGDSVRRAESLCAALGGELDLSHTTLDQRACGALALMLDFSEGLEELNLSHCQLTDQLLLTLITHLHKVHVLDLSHNKITDVSTDKLLQLVCINPSTVTVRLFGNNIVDRTTFKKHTQFEIW
uniref:Si:ch211-108d22.2 n=1 Tax=Lates calcarifer TaxID=8187 RepID=A0A4W6D4A3_LATCA